MSKLAHSHEPTMLEIERRAFEEEHGLKIVTSFVFPPIPTRDNDWQAIFDGDEPDDNGNMRFVGRGTTEAEAIGDLITQFME